MENNNDMSTANAVSVARGWKVETVMRAAAAYFIVDEEGKKFLATSGKGGKVRSIAHATIALIQLLSLGSSDFVVLFRSSFKSTRRKANLLLSSADG